MLNDLERKLHRILYNYILTHNSMPDRVALERMTGRRFSDIEKALIELEKKKYIEWPHKPHLRSIIVLQSGEIPETMNKPRKGTSQNIDYYLYY